MTKNEHKLHYMQEISPSNTVKKTLHIEWYIDYQTLVVKFNGVFHLAIHMPSVVLFYSRKYRSAYDGQYVYTITLSLVNGNYQTLEYSTPEKWEYILHLIGQQTELINNKYQNK